MNDQLSNYKLNYISTQYRKFSKGQYVDDLQFNEFLDFFEDQDRLSRVMLQGVGIVCGFQPKLGYTNNKISSVFISQGIAITTDGDLLTLNNKSKAKKINDDSDASELKTIDFSGNLYTHWKAYDNYKVKYPAFHDNSGEQIELWELSGRVNAKAGFQPLTVFDSLEDKCLLLYLEDYEKEAKPCKGVDCDNHGIQQVRNLKILLTTISGIEKILETDTVFPHPVLLNLVGEEKIKRVVLTKNQNTTESIRLGYSSAIGQSQYTSIIDNVDSVCGIMNQPVINRSGFITTLNSLISQAGKIQYAYEVLKDLTDTYSEIVAQLYKSFTKSLPDLQAFPKHIMLGGLTSDTRFDSKKHQFYNSPALDNEKMDYSRLLLLIERFRQQVQEFKGPVVLGNGGAKITPSQHISPLGKKAIPFYYNVTNKFLDAWDFDKTRNRVSNSNLGFDKTILSGSGNIQTPTIYNIDNKPFYRIEGHHGSNYSDVVSTLRQIKDNDQLGFDVMAVSLTQLTDNKDFSKVYFTDYVEKHSGLEHLGGVKRGGTFAVVYESETNPSVIADFSLPYICCTPKSDVSLSLPVSTICNNAAPVIFKVTPANGVVSGHFEKTFSLIAPSTGVQNINGQYVFNPQAISADLLNEKITFKVDGKPTNCSITVLPLSNLQIVPQVMGYPDGNSLATTVTFTVSGENIEDYVYKWDFSGNGSYVLVKPDSDGKVTHNYFKIDSTTKVNVLVSANGCSSIYTLEDWYAPPKEIFSVDIVKPLNTTVTLNELVTFDSTVRGATGIVSYMWSCTNENAVIRNPTLSSTVITFTAPGNSYLIKLAVTDSVQGTISTTKSISVAVK